MRIQAANTIYTGTYSVLNTKSSFPYAVKVEGYGKTRNQRSLFQFAHVTITEHMVNMGYRPQIMAFLNIWSCIWIKGFGTFYQCFRS